MKSDQSTADPEQKVMGALCELAASLPDMLEPDARAAVVELLATAAMPPAGVYQQKENGQQIVELLVPADPWIEHVSVTLSDPDSGAGLLVMMPAVEARAMLGAAAVVERTRGFVDDTYQSMLGELDYQVACYRQGRTPQPPDHREERLDLEVMQAGDGKVIDVATVDGTRIDVATAARLLGFDDRQTAMLATIRAGECIHPGLPPADSVTPFDRRPCPVCGQRLQAYPANVNESGKPEWQAIP